MDTKKGKSYLVKNDFDLSPIWKFCQTDDLTYPVFNYDDFPDDSRDLCIKAQFNTPTNLKFEGYIVGVKNIFCIAIYLNNQTLFFNKNLPKNCLKSLEKINKLLGLSLTIQDISPLKYSTIVNWECFKNMNGEINFLQKRTNEERLEEL
jgi:hypothetical protein